MTLFSEVTAIFLLQEVKKRIDASIEADELDIKLRGILGRDHELAKEKRLCLKTLNTSLEALPESDDESYKNECLRLLDETKTALDKKREQTNQEASTTEQTLRILHDFVTSLFYELNTQNLLDYTVSEEPMCELHRCIISYLANRNLNKAQETAKTQGNIHRLMYHPKVTPNTSFLQVSDHLVKTSIHYIQDTLSAYGKPDKHYQRRKDTLAKKELRALELELKDLREDPKYSWYGFCLPTDLTHYIYTAQQNIASSLVQEIPEEKSVSNSSEALQHDL
ncbi:MAG: hypothetical protein P1U61_01505 [Legionellaceae bacterium]|nr:hypothetical protein [Legionellaceae bacterium]